MKSLRTVLLALLLALPLGAVAAPARAAGENCVSNPLSKRCADITGQDGAIYANGGIDSLKGRVKVRIVSVTLQYKMDVGWVTNSETRPEKVWVSGGAYSSAANSCDGAADGKWRSKVVVEWKRGRDGEVHRAKVVGDPVGRDRLCG